jgi:hypothetical protein
MTEIFGMTIEEARPYDGLYARVTYQIPPYGVSSTIYGRVEILDDQTLQIVGEATTGGMSLGDTAPLKFSIEFISEIST